MQQQTTRINRLFGNSHPETERTGEAQRNLRLSLAAGTQGNDKERSCAHSGKMRYGIQDRTQSKAGLPVAVEQKQQTRNRRLQVSFGHDGLLDNKGVD